MPYTIQCADNNCGRHTRVRNIAELIMERRDPDGWFLCSCGNRGYIKKSFALQEDSEVWEPILKGAIVLGEEGGTYQPFVYSVSYTPEEAPTSYWFSYYKDTRPTGGVLKCGHGPGGPPVLHRDDLLALLNRMIKLNLVTKDEILNVIS